MISFQKISDFASYFADTFTRNTQNAFEDLVKNIAQLQPRYEQQKIQDGFEQERQMSQGQKLDAELEDVELVESRQIENRAHTQTSSKNHSHHKRRRIKQIEEQKRKIAQELHEIDKQIQSIKGKNQGDNAYKKRQKIYKDQNAQKQAEMLVRELKNQRKQIQNRKKMELEKSLQEMQKQDEERRRKREQQALRIKEERRLAILQRMEQEKKRRQERKVIQAQSNQLISKLKKEEELEKVMSMAPSQLMEVDNKKKVLEKKNNFDFRQIQEHDRKYRQLKQRKNKQKQERSKSLKLHNQDNTQKYARNVWIERIEQEENRKKQEERQLSERKKTQLEKRMKYGELVKNIFAPKKKDKETDTASVPIVQHKDEDEQLSQLPRTQPKPKTPQEGTALPKIKTSNSRVKNTKFFRDQSAQGIRNNSKKIVIEKKGSVKEFDADEQQKQKIRKIRQLQLRKQTKQRLKKLQSHSLNKPEGGVDEKKKYKNYLGEVKVKKQGSSQWKRIINDNRLTEQQKYQQLMRKAENLEAKAKLKEDKYVSRETDEDAVNLYIGSIQAKLALLQKF